jgi:HEAT repeat protein
MTLLMRFASKRSDPYRGAETGSPLHRFAGDASVAIRRQVIETVGRLADERGRALLIAGLTDPADLVRSAAAHELHRLGRNSIGTAT